MHPCIVNARIFQLHSPKQLHPRPGFRKIVFIQPIRNDALTQPRTAGRLTIVPSHPARILRPPIHENPAPRNLLQQPRIIRIPLAHRKPVQYPIGHIHPAHRIRTQIRCRRVHRPLNHRIPIAIHTLHPRPIRHHQPASQSPAIPRTRNIHPVRHPHRIPGPRRIHCILQIRRRIRPRCIRCHVRSPMRNIQLRPPGAYNTQKKQKN